MLGKLLMHQKFSAEKNKKSAFVISIFLSRNRHKNITRNASESGQWQDASRNLILLSRE
jgi:hypothetical protein